jgi:hypothetical protein
MKRPREHVSEEKSVQIFSRSVPAEWINRSVTPDYGLDRSIEIVEDGNVTGKELNVQLKGVEKPRVVNGCISLRLKVKNLKYYMQREGPTLLVVVDLKNEKCYWVFIQKCVYDTLDIIKPSWAEQKTITIHLPLENEISKDKSELAKIAKKGTSYLTIRKIDKIPNEHLIDWETNTDAIRQLNKVDRLLGKKQADIRFETSYRNEMEGKLGDSAEILWKIYNDSIASDNDLNSMKSALCLTFHLNPMNDRESKMRHDLLSSVRDKVEVLKNKTFHFLWWSVFLETIYCKLLKDYNSRKTLQMVSSQSLYDMNSPFLQLQNQKSLEDILRIRSDMVEYINEAYNEKEYYAYVDLLWRLAKMQWSWCYHESLGGDPNLIYSSLKPVEKILILAEEVSRILSKDYQINVLLDLATYYDSINKIKEREKSLTQAEEIAKQIGHKGHIQEIERLRIRYNNPHITIHSALQMDFSKQERAPITDEEEENMIRHLLKIGGIDLNGDDEFARLARIGLKDRNPERVLKHCKHLHAEIVNYGPIWDMFALPSTGTKILFCEKNNAATIGRELDHLFAKMQRENCIGCKHHSPRPAGWKWTHEWHKKRKKPARMKTIVANFFG